MRGFIELHYNKMPRLLNVNCVSAVSWQPDGSAATVLQSGEEREAIRFDETYEEIKALIASAQGGIPMPMSGGKA